MDFWSMRIYRLPRAGRAEIVDEVRAMPPMKDMYGMGFDPRFFALSAFRLPMR
jgi:hypothetical protein